MAPGKKYSDILSGYNHPQIRIFDKGNTSVFSGLWFSFFALHFCNPVARSSNTCALTDWSIIFCLFWTCHMLISCCDSCLLAFTGKAHSGSSNKRMEITVSGQIRMIIYFLLRQHRLDWDHVKSKSQSCYTSQKTENAISPSVAVVSSDLP